MNILGAIIAGGQSRRFGSDKAQAQWRGRALIEHVAEALAVQCNALVVVGREYPGLAVCGDVPAPGRGPLGGLAGALDYAFANGFALVMTAGVDTLPFPSDVCDHLMPAPAHAAENPLIGLWPVSMRQTACDMASSDGDRSLRNFARRIGARPVELAVSPRNINTIADLAALESQP